MSFSVITSTLAPSELSVYVGQNYFSGNTVNCKLIKTGINHTYKIEYGAVEFILRVYCYHWRTEIEIREELNLLDFINDSGISVSYPIKDTSGNLVQCLNAPEGPRYAVLFSIAPGKKVQNYSSDIHFNVGSLMGKFHKLTIGKTINRMSYDAKTLIDDSLVKISRFLDKDSDEMKFMTEAGSVINSKLKEVKMENIKTGIVHLDIWFDNLNISENGEITLFDFDFCGNGWQCMDVAYYIMQLYNVEKVEKDRIRKMEAFYEGYRSIVDLSDDEMKMIPALGVALYFFYLGVQCERFENWSNIFMNEVYIKRYIKVFIQGYYDHCMPA